MYDFKVKYIILKNTDFNLIIDEYHKIKNRQDIENFEIYLKNRNIKFFSKENNILEIEKIEKQIKNGILDNKKIFHYKFNNFINIIFIEKKLESYEGVKAKLIQDINIVDFINCSASSLVYES